MKTYLGDSVYGEFINGNIHITTDNGYGPTNIIVMEPEVCAALVTFFEECYRKKSVAKQQQETNEL